MQRPEHSELTGSPGAATARGSTSPGRGAGRHAPRADRRRPIMTHGLPSPTRRPQRRSRRAPRRRPASGSQRRPGGHDQPAAQQAAAPQQPAGDRQASQGRRASAAGKRARARRASARQLEACPPRPAPLSARPTRDCRQRGGSRGGRRSRLGASVTRRSGAPDRARHRRALSKPAGPGRRRSSWCSSASARWPPSRCRCAMRSAACWPRRRERRRRAPASTTRRWTASPCAPPTREAPAPSSPVRLAVVGESRAGQPGRRGAPAGEAIRISTGAMLPEGADAVVRKEDCRDAGEHGRGAGRGRARQGGAARRRGHPGRRASCWSAGTLLGPAELGVLASVGAAEVSARGGRESRVLVDRRRAGGAGRAARARGRSATRTPTRSPPRSRRRARELTERRLVPDDRAATVEAIRAGLAAMCWSSAEAYRSGPRPRQAGASRSWASRRSSGAWRCGPDTRPGSESERTGHARVRPSRQPGLGDGHLPSVRAAGARGAGGRGRDSERGRPRSWTRTTASGRAARTWCAAGSRRATTAGTCGRRRRRDRTCSPRCWAPRRWRCWRSSAATSRRASGSDRAALRLELEV